MCELTMQKTTPLPINYLAQNMKNLYTDKSLLIRNND